MSLGFYINLPVGGLVAVLLVFLNIPEQIPKPKGLKSVATVLGNLDLIGFTLFAPAAIMFLLALQYGGSTYPWNSATIIGLFVGAGVTFIIFMLWEYRVGDKAMIPYSILTIRTVWASCVTYGFLASLLICGSYYLPIYFQAIKNASPMISGVDILPSIISQMISAILSGQLCMYNPRVTMCATTNEEFYSGEGWLLFTVERTRCFSCRYRQWIDFDLFNNDQHWKVDWISDYLGCGSWYWFTNGNFMTPTSLISCIERLT